MTQEELKYLNFTIETHFRVLRLVRKQYHNNNGLMIITSW